MAKYRANIDATKRNARTVKTATVAELCRKHGVRYRILAGQGVYRFVSFHKYALRAVLFSISTEQQNIVKVA